MAYVVIVRPKARAFIRDLQGLTREERLRLQVDLLEPLRADGDCFRRHGDRVDAEHFWYSLILHGEPPRAFRFLVRDFGAVYGVLEVVRAEEVKGKSG